MKDHIDDFPILQDCKKVFEDEKDNLMAIYVRFGYYPTAQAIYNGFNFYWSMKRTVEKLPILQKKRENYSTHVQSILDKISENETWKKEITAVEIEKIRKSLPIICTEKRINKIIEIIQKEASREIIKETKKDLQKMVSGYVRFWITQEFIKREN